MAYVLKQFALVRWGGDPFLAPECRANVASGLVYGHPEFRDGDKIETSDITEVKGRIVRTSSGSEYRLVGRPLKAFLVWLKEKGIAYNGKEPFKGLEKYICGEHCRKSPPPPEGE